MDILIAGCGYIGLPLGRALKSRNHEVAGWVFSEKSGRELAASGLDPIVGDLAASDGWEKYRGCFDAIVYCPSTRGGDPGDYRRIYVEGMRNALGGLKPGGHFFYTGSTSVYGQNDGSLVDEHSSTEPGSESGKILLEAEETALSAGGTVLRLSAIYGPERGVMLKRFLEASGPLPGNPDRYLNQIHRDDVVSAALFLFDGKESGGGIFNVSDNHPATHREIHEWLAKTLQKPLPGFTGEPVYRKRGGGNRRVSNRKLLNLGWSPRYASYKEGYAALMASQEP